MECLSRCSFVLGEVLCSLDSNLRKPDAEVIEKRLHSLLIVAALLLTASLTLFDLPTEREMLLELIDIDLALQQLSRLTEHKAFYMGCTMLGYACELEQHAQRFLNGENVTNPIEDFRDSFLYWTSLSTHLSFMGLVLAMLCYLSLNHTSNSSVSLTVWYRLNCLCILGSYLLAGGAAVSMCYAFNALIFLKGGFRLYLLTLQRTYVLGIATLISAGYLVIALVVANIQTFGERPDVKYSPSIGSALSSSRAIIHPADPRLSVLPSPNVLPVTQTERNRRSSHSKEQRTIAEEEEDTQRKGATKNPSSAKNSLPKRRSVFDELNLNVDELGDVED